MKCQEVINLSEKIEQSLIILIHPTFLALKDHECHTDVKGVAKGGAVYVIWGVLHFLEILSLEMLQIKIKGKSSSSFFYYLLLNIISI